MCLKISKFIVSFSWCRENPHRVSFRTKDDILRMWNNLGISSAVNFLQFLIVNDFPSGIHLRYGEVSSSSNFIICWAKVSLSMGVVVETFAFIGSCESLEGEPSDSSLLRAASASAMRGALFCERGREFTAMMIVF